MLWAGWRGGLQGGRILRGSREIHIWEQIVGNRVENQWYVQVDLL
jgi:hypothetical protein